MGFLKKAGKIGGKVGLAPFTGGLSLLGKDTLFGKKDPGSPDRFLELDPSLRAVTEEARKGQEIGARSLRDELERVRKVDPLRRARLEEAQELKLLKGAGEDARRLAQQEVAKRGLGQSSIGLSAILRADEKAREGMARARAIRPIREEEAVQRKVGQIGQITSGLSGILAAPGQTRAFMPGRAPTGRSGGLVGALLPVAGMAGGAYLGSMAGKPYTGAQTGGQFGQDLYSIIKNRQQSAMNYQPISTGTAVA